MTMMVATTAFAAPAMAEEPEANEIELFLDYMEIAEQFLSFANRTDAAVFFAVEGVVEIHEERGELAAAIPVLKSFLDQYPDNQAVRNVIHFKLRDLFRDTGQAEQALAQLRTVVDENS
ncbi:MAG: hypothetical protein QNJ44_09825 [Rhodobacter sp.]|nr:hypothetical protein [Rhodobacter sp.]